MILSKYSEVSQYLAKLFLKYEAETAEADNPGIWTYVVYDCAAGEEEVVTNLDINTVDPVLELQKLAGV